MNFLEFFVDTSLSFLELFNLLEDLLALATASVHECVSCCTPIESLDTRLDGTVQLIKMLLEQKLLLKDILFLVLIVLVLLDLGNCMHDGVVVTDDKHDILTQDSQLLFLAEEL